MHVQFAKAIMLNEPLPTSVKDLYRLQNEMAVELLNSSGSMQIHCFSCVISPLLFLCNDLPDHLTSNVGVHADDVLVYTTINSDCDSRNLQNDINKL